MPSYDSFMCPNCEHYFRVIWPDPMPSYHDSCSKIKMKCPDCGEVTELYDFLIDRIMCAPDCLRLDGPRTHNRAPDHQRCSKRSPEQRVVNR